MIKRTISIGKPCRISLKAKQLVLWFPETEKEALIPAEDVGIFILDHPQITITHACMNALIDNNAALLWCNEKHLPNGLVLPMAQNHVFTEKLQAQLGASEPLKKQLWKQNIQAKIQNQARVLEMLGKPNEALLHMRKEVRSGDPMNLEGRAARWYWKVLFDEIEGFTRGRDGGSPNNLLNYGYAILRSVVARALVASGCLPAVGIHHRNKYNAFCLADDMMESYRPVVDLVVVDIIRETGELPEELEKEHKAELLKIPVADVMIEGKSSPLMVAVQRSTASLMRCFEGAERKLLLPLI